MKNDFTFYPPFFFVLLFLWAYPLIPAEGYPRGIYRTLCSNLEGYRDRHFDFVRFYTLSKVNLIASFVLALVLGVFHLANVEYIYALDHVVNLKDITMASDKEFIAGTLFHVSFPIYSILLMASLMASIFFSANCRCSR